MKEPTACRFCGRVPRQGNTVINDQPYVKYSCLHCHTDGSPSQNIEDAVADWNVRFGDGSPSDGPSNTKDTPQVLFKPVMEKYRELG